MHIFYDIESTGLSKSYAQILQIAFIVTDDHFNILAKKQFDARLSPWVVASPGAMLVTGFNADKLAENPYTAYTMMKAVHDWLAEQGVKLSFDGYNSIGYDEPVFSANSYQNLMNPRLTVSNGNGRCDVLLAVKAVQAYMPGALVLERKTEKGNVTLTLMNVAEQNGVVLSAEDAHDAGNDGLATVGIAAVIAKAAPQIWEQMMKLSTAEGVEAFMESNKVFTYLPVIGKAGPGLVSSLGGNLLFDLTMEPTPYLDMSVEELTAAFNSKKNNPFRSMNRYNQPILMPLELSETVLPADYNEELCAKRAALLTPEFREKMKMAAVYTGEKKEHDDIQAEDMIFAALDEATQAKMDAWCKEFTSADDWSVAAALVENFNTRFEEELKQNGENVRRYNVFAARIVFENAPEELSAQKQEDVKRYIATRTMDPSTEKSYTTLARARKELNDVIEGKAAGKSPWKDVEDADIAALAKYYDSIEKQYGAYAPKFETAPAPVAPVEQTVKGPSAGSAPTI